MTHQAAVTLRARIKSGAVDDLRASLAEIGSDVEGNARIPFARLEGVHFARFALLDAVEALAGELIPASLVYVASVDAPAERHLTRLTEVAGEGLDCVFGHCEGYPPPGERTSRTRLEYLKSRTIDTQAFYVNTIGRPVDQIRQEGRLREALQIFLDRYLESLAGAPSDAAEVRRAIMDFVGGDDRFRWALSPARRPALAWRIGEWLKFGSVVLLLLLLLPILLVLVPIWLLIIRSREKRGAWELENRLSEQFREELTSQEDHVVQNQLTAVGFVKPGWVRAATLRVLLWVLNFGCRHYFNRGDLGTIRLLGLHGVDTIHFARWIILDQGRRVLFCSNYDGSMESYMDDFVNKVAWGLNLVFTNGVGYPKTRWLVLGGAKDEQEFKAFVRRHQLITPVWYTAYKHLSAVNIQNNAEIRAGLSRRLDRRQTEEWLRRL